jgi:hypothetical protein
MSGAGLDQKVCCVCDRFGYNKNSEKLDIFDDLTLNNGDMLERMQKRLVHPVQYSPTINGSWKRETLNQLLLNYYDCTSLHSGFDGLMLSRRGITRNDEEKKVTINVCKECLKSLSYSPVDKPDYSLPPKFAICNGFFIGALPENLIPTFAESAMTSLITFNGLIRVIRGGLRKAIKSHLMLFDAVPLPPHYLLPRTLNTKVDYRIILAGSMTHDQKQLIRKQHETRRAVINDILDFYLENNILYEKVRKDLSYLSKINEDTISSTFTTSTQGNFINNNILSINIYYLSFR